MAKSSINHRAQQLRKKIRKPIFCFWVSLCSVREVFTLKERFFSSDSGFSWMLPSRKNIEIKKLLFTNSLQAASEILLCFSHSVTLKVLKYSQVILCYCMPHWPVQHCVERTSVVSPLTPAKTNITLENHHF